MNEERQNSGIGNQESEVGMLGRFSMVLPGLASNGSWILNPEF
jgi:hypothetical protein